jgi:hypothetical protein
MMKISNAATKIAMFLLLSAAVAPGQTIVRSFDGDRGPGLAACQSGLAHCDRPDMNVAANGKQLVQVTWQNIRIYDYNGKLLQAMPMSKLITNAGLNPNPVQRRPSNGPHIPGPIEPTIVYDEFLDRWLMTVTGHNEALLVSATSDAMGSWGGTYLSCLNGGPCLDYDAADHLGYDKNGVYVCGGHIGASNPATIPGVAYDCFAVPPAEVVAIAQGTPPAHINRGNSMPLDVFPAIDHNKHKASNAPAFFLAKTCGQTPQGACQNATDFQFEWVINTFTWVGAAGTYNTGGGQYTVKTGVGSKEDVWFYSKPCCGSVASIPQAGSSIPLRAAESHRMHNLVQFGTHLFAVEPSGPCTGSCGSQGTDTTNVLFWADLDCSKPASCIVNQTGKIAGAGFNPEFATVGVDAKGNIGIVAESSTADTGLSLLLWTRRNSDPPNTLRGPVTILKGTHPYTCIRTDFSSIGNPVGILTTLDPKDPMKLWTTQQWGGDAAPCVWTTRIIEYQIQK